MTREEAFQEKKRMRTAALKKAEKRKEELYAALPELRGIDRRLAAFGPRIVAAAMSEGPEAVAALKEENLALQKERGDLLTASGYRADEDAPVFSCEKCQDTGYQLLNLCSCIKEMTASENYRSAGLGKGLDGKTFDNFSLAYYKGEDHAKMRLVLNACSNYAETFDKDSRSLLMIGRTGLGKTHLSAAIAETVAAKGFRVIYESAQKLFDNYENSRFGRQQESMEKVESYESCDLLLIDDLGTECASQYTSATFFNLLNTRLICRKPTIISTNLQPKELEKTYGERIYSRLCGEFRLLPFSGEDVRMQKLRAQS